MTSRPVRGGALWLARRIVLGVRAALAVVAVVSGVMAATTEDTDLSNRWTVVLVGTIVVILLGGLVWWVEPSTPPALRRRERFRTAGRWLRAVLAAGGTGLFFYWTIVDEVGLSYVALATAAGSPLVYLVLTAIGKAVSPPEWAPSQDAEPGWWRRRHEQARAAIATLCETLVEPGVRRGALTIRPRTGAVTPDGLAAWLRNGALGTDGTSLVVTGRSGRTFRVPLAVDGGYGATGLLVVRESVVTSTQYGRSVPRSRELLCVLDSAGRRMVDIELYGWTRSDLVALARASGLRLARYAPQERQEAVANLRGQTPTALDHAIPRADAHRTVRGRSPWRDAPIVVALSVVTVAGYFGVSYLVGAVQDGLALPAPWQTIVPWGLGAVMIGVLIVVLRWVATRYEQRRQAARAPSVDAP